VPRRRTLLRGALTYHSTVGVPSTVVFTGIR
jgi:hypothetical protein